MKIRSLLVAFALVFLLYASNASAAVGGAFSFTLAGNASTSAGVYASNGTLIRTLWSGKQYNAGTHVEQWDGLLDDGTTAPADTYSIKVLSDNVQYTWDGVIGNTSSSFTGPTVLRMAYPATGIAITGNTAYIGAGYEEAWSSQMKVSLSNTGSKTWIGLTANPGTNQDTTYNATDGTYVYWGGYDPYQTTDNFVFATRVSDDGLVTFPSGTADKMTYGSITYSAISQVVASNALITGLAVQKTGNYLFVARAGLNQLQVLNKTTGALVQTLTFAGAGAVTVDQNDNLWLAHDGNVAEKYTVNSDGTLTTTGTTVTSITQIAAFAVSPDNATLLIADMSTQQVKAFNNATGASLWTLGTAGGYLTDATATNNKFFWYGLDPAKNGDRIPSLAFQSDGSFWVGDPGNDRIQHYAANRSFVDNIAWVETSYDTQVKQQDPTRLFNKFKEYRLDYSKTLSPGNNGAWTLANNWEGNYLSQYDNGTTLLDINTLSNNRTYALVREGQIRWVVELVNGGVIRYTGLQMGPNEFITADGSKVGEVIFAQKRGVGQQESVYKYPLLSFDSSNNPVWSTSQQVLATSPVMTLSDTSPEGLPPNADYYITSSGKVVFFDAYSRSVTGGGEYHLGAIQTGDNRWAWQTAQGTFNAYAGDFPPDGYFDDGNGVVDHGAGGGIVIYGDQIFWGYHGEFWKQGQTNYWNEVDGSTGLFVGQFGLGNRDVAGQEAPAEGAGNTYGGAIVQVGGHVYLYHNDESYHAGVHRWEITGLNTIAVQTATFPTSLTYVPPTGTDLLAGLPYGGTTLVDGTAGWNRIPTTDNANRATNNNWVVTSGLKSYNNFQSPDLNAAIYKQVTSTTSLSKSLGNNSNLNVWTLSGQVNFGTTAANSPGPTEGAYIQVLDTNGVAIGRFYMQRNPDASNSVMGNNQTLENWDTTLIHTTPGIMQSVIAHNQPFSISNNAGVLTFTYAGISSTTSTMATSGADPSSPTTVQMAFFNNTSSTTTDRGIDLFALNFYSPSVAPILSTTSVTSLPSGTTSTSLAITTNVSSMCSYSTTPNTAYSSMTPFDTNGGTSHTTALTGLLDGNTYTYYIRCSDTSHNTNTSDYSVSFNVASAAPDTTPPAISAVSSGTPGQTSTTISWTTDEASDSQVTYGPTTAYGSTTTLNTTLVTTHSVTLSGLSANTLYHYEVVSKDAAGNITISTDRTFTTTAAPDITAPTVSLTAPANGSNLLGTITLSATASDNVGVVGVQFNIDGTPAQSEDTSAPYAIDYNTTALSAGSHTLSATARDAAGNRTTSTVFTITVNNTPPDTTPPVISAISSGTPTQSATTITWTTNESADSRILYGTTSSYGSATTLNASLVTTHTAAVTGLLSGTLYHYQIVSKDAAGNTATATDRTFTTASAPDTTPPAISAVSSGTPGQTSTTISWTTDEASDSQVTYGPTTAYGSTTTLNTTLVTTHSVTLSGLSANTLYHYEVVSKDAAANTATSTDNTFTTTIIPDIIAPTVVMVTPLDLSTISGTNTLSVLALDDVGISGVQFNLDGSPLQSEVTAVPYTIDLDTTTLSAGSHTLSATARDAAGNHTTSLPISVVVNNVVVSSGGGGGSYTPPSGGGGGGGGGGGSYIPPVTTTTPTTTVALASDCLGTTAFSALLGTPCANFNQPTSPTTTTTPSTTITTGAKVRVNVTSNSLLVRSSIGGSVAGYVPENTIGTVLDTVASINGLSWVQVKFPKVTGWASSTYLAPTGGTTIVTTTSTIISTLPVTSTAKPIATTTPSAKVKVNVTSNSLRLRSTIGGSIAGYVPNKTVGTVLQTIPSINGLSWIQVKFPKATGWTSSTYLASVSPSTSVATTTPVKTVKKAGPVVTTATVTTAIPKPAATTTTLATTTTTVAPSTGRKVVVTASSISVYPFPSTSSATVTVPRFTQGTVNTTIDGWISVVFSNGVKGWIQQGGVLVY